MCMICRNECTIYTTSLDISWCHTVKKIPDTLISLTHLNCSYTNIIKIPDTLVNLKKLFCSGTNITTIPDTFIHLTDLHCHNTKIIEIPNTLVNLTDLTCHNTNIIKIPETITKLKNLHCTECWWLKSDNTKKDWNYKMKKVKCIQKYVREKKFKRIKTHTKLYYNLIEFVVKYYYI